jgi:hypothetical protein
VAQIKENNMRTEEEIRATIKEYELRYYKELENGNTEKVEMLLNQMVGMRYCLGDID